MSIKKAKSHRSALLSTIPLSLAALSFVPSTALAEEMYMEIISPDQRNDVALVPFAGDTVISPVVLNDLQKTELTVTSENLPQQLHNSSELTGSLPAWQSLAIPYLIIGSTQSNRGNVEISYEVVDVTNGRVIEGKQTLTTKSDSGSLRHAAHVISDKVYELITGTPGDFSGRIAYIEETGVGANKTSELKVIDADGENPRTITSVKGSIFSPAWSPDGNRIAYAVQQPKGYPVIYVQSIDGGGAQVVTPFKGTNLSPSFSPDGSSMLFSGSHEGNADIYQIHLGSGTVKRLVNLPSNEVQPTYAPDGNSFVFVSDRDGFNKPQLYRYTFATGQVSKISSAGSYATSPQFNHDGSQIAFLNGRSAAIMSSSGGGASNIGNTGLDEGASFSPNGTRVVYASKQGNQGVLNIKSLNGGESFGKSAKGIIRSPVWSNPSN